ncbi:MAG: glycerol-3-phosphate 1-O-acyltransferase PlsY [Candidatus Competibacteraceae bacterium]|nr:glycerol-3-phosphate 1-O-acyltransferase PlsY [Candidatus Competibacteraceae bacterium]MBK8896304.1 glycerol-3-phosphate 1-O-acyltransferase PlsY [Candidatus Competibacteraceae bacterium]MBK8964886.1 glycerol-3-phosphate 1-O-acyltransferase PlsY [Candidatus Competibacteraceae bacterium]MBK9950167.1 glycerol-3-phosphate 1-O-acyltransferase PlsY [Candidatus Competibacteraceae bacterium]
MTTSLFATVLSVVLGYLAGSVSTAIIVCRIMGLPDPRSEGSRNPGATNVLRFGGKKAAAITLAGDFLKGLAPVLLARLAGLEETGLALTGLAAFLGHLYPVFFGFEGGKGVATAFGVILALSWPVALAALVTWLFMAFVVRVSSLSALTAAALAPLFAWWFGLPGGYLAAVLVMVGLLIWRHRSNIRNLLAGTEGKIGTDRS